MNTITYQGHYVDTNLPISLDKQVVILFPACINKSMRNTIWGDVNATLASTDSFGFLEWAEPFVARLNRRYPLADVRLMTAEEMDEMGVAQ